MAEQLQKLVAEKKDMVETVMEVFEQGAEVVASIAGDLFPVFSIAAPIVKLALDNVESKEATFMKEQFQKVRERLEVVSEEIQRINDEIKKSGMDAMYFSVEENITNQFRKYMDILNAKPKVREVKKKLFLDHFARTGGDKNLYTLYNAVTGDNFSGEPVLEITLNYEEKSRRAMEEFCARLKKLFCIGLIALLGHAALKGYDEEDALLKDWSEKMNTVQAKMNTVIEDCIVSFPTQAELATGCCTAQAKHKKQKRQGLRRHLLGGTGTHETLFTQAAMIMPKRSDGNTLFTYRCLAYLFQCHSFTCVIVQHKLETCTCSKLILYFDRGFTFI
ncbi:protein rapunzel-like isoform X3 [Toxotes jaculatrix]|uniref:protein rapunzel-like isoform X3 n=1 Tax=Toxotes jaculatrix TaxID=941984 RepID=UPI001B3B02A0|nr:protein rapunzel-like isoform X3 [Toxotes jaculatrix]